MRNWFALVLLIAFAAGLSSVSAQESQTLTIFAAASLSDAFTEIAQDFETAHPGTDILFNFAGSSALATQLAEGAPADLFASANNRQLSVARDAGRIGGKIVTFAKNRLVLIVPADNPAAIQTLHDLAKTGVRLIVAAPDVPVRDYTNTMLDRLSADPAYGETYRAAFMANIVSEEDNVRQVAAKVALGEADAGIVYRSDVTPDIAHQVLMLTIPDTINTIATYPAAITNDTPNPELAQAFIDYLIADAGQDTLEKWNFISVRIPELAPTIALTADNVLHVEGQVLNSLQVTVDDLRRNYTAHTVEVTYQSGEETITSSFTGALLWDMMSSAQANFNADVRGDKLSMFIVATGSDGYQAVISWAEIDPDYGNQPVIVAYEQDGHPIADKLGPVRLVVPGDKHGERYVSGLANLNLRDAPKVQ